MKTFALNSLRIMTAAAILAVPGLAQGQKGPNPSAPGSGQAQINMAMATAVSGKITAVQIAYGAQYPSITLEGKTIKIAPVWFMLDNDFELAAGDEVKVLAAPSAKEGDPSLYAITIEKPASGVTLTLRSEAGIPMWTMPSAGPNANTSGAGYGGTGNPSSPRLNQGAGCVDPATITEVKGVVDAVTLGAGIQQPQLTVIAGGKSLTVKIGPERLILAADFELKTGMTLTVRYATATCTGELIALSLSDESGARIVLRNDIGTPAWN